MKIWLPLFLVVAVGAFALVTRAQDEEERAITGAVPSHTSTEKFHMPLGVNALGDPGRPIHIRQYRENLNVPGYYGELVAVTAHGESAVLWYRDGNGSIRNAVLPRPDQTLYLLTPMKVSNFALDIHK